MCRAPICCILRALSASNEPFAYELPTRRYGISGPYPSVEPAIFINQAAKM
jgi:hypothetical protein